MTQSRVLSLLEAASSVAAGFVLSLGMQAVLFPAVGLHASLSQNLRLALAFTGLSLLRGYVVRRLFERRAQRQAPGGEVISLHLSDRGPAGAAIFSRGHNSDRGSRTGARR